MALLLAVLIFAACSQTQPVSTTSADAAPASTVAESQSAAVASGAVAKLNLNRAPREQFQTIPNVGNRMVREFNEYRPYASILESSE